MLTVSQTRRNWTELPDEVTAAILSRLGAFEVLKTAHLVCKSWRRVCHNPLTWRSIDMRNVGDVRSKFDKICRLAVDRSSGNAVDINLEYFATPELLQYIVQSSSRIRRLRLACCNEVLYTALSELASKLPLLEDLEISFCAYSHRPLEAVGRSCPRLKSLKLNQTWSNYRNLNCDYEALAIARTMQGLHHLQLVGNSLTNDGLSAILDSCPHLESLDLHNCLNLYLEGGLVDLGRRCAERIKNLRLLNDFIDNIEFVAFIHWYRRYGFSKDAELYLKMKNYTQSYARGSTAGYFD